jgi:OOP family OmpA-OmpF porin
MVRSARVSRHGVIALLAALAVLGTYASLCGMFALPAAAQTRTDVEGGRDHPLLPRYRGSSLIGFRDQTYAEVQPLKAIAAHKAEELKLDRKLTIEGEVSERFYVAPKGRSALEVQRNYETALTQAGAKLLYTCKEGDSGCPSNGADTPGLLTSEIPRKQQSKDAFRAFNGSANLRLAVLQYDRDGAIHYITLLSVDPGQHAGQFSGSAATYVQISQAKAMDTGMVEQIDPGRVVAALKADGRMPFYGLFFDSGKAELKPESKGELDLIARSLADEPALKVFIVGHTDNQGSVDGNIGLSQRRAEAVVAALIREHKIDASRLVAKGVASFSPQASNADEIGRAKNRRVELVVQ